MAFATAPKTSAAGENDKKHQGQVVFHTNMDRRNGEQPTLFFAILLWKMGVRSFLQAGDVRERCSVVFKEQANLLRWCILELDQAIFQEASNLINKQSEQQADYHPINKVLFCFSPWGFNPLQGK
jgi:hypothetical protein